jgi:RecA-family ATPase
MPSAEAIRIAKRAVADRGIAIMPAHPSDEMPRDDIPSANSFEEFGLSPDAGPDGEAGAKAPAPEVTALELETPAQWCGVPIPPMRWLATNRIPADDTVILSGDGGGGKTTIALQLAVAVAGDLGDWLGTTCETGPVIFFSGEEQKDEMRRRLQRVARKRGLEPDDLENLHFHFADLENCLLGSARPNGPVIATPLFASIYAAAAAIRPRLLIVDSIAATFCGNQNDRTHARTFVAMFRRLAGALDCAVLLLDHPSLSGMTNGTGRGGSMDWQNASRGRMHLETVEDEDGGTSRVLELKKINSGAPGERVKMCWEDGCYVLQGSAAAPAQAAAFNAADQSYLDCLDAMTVQGRHVCHAKGRGYAPKAFADMPQAKGMTWKAFQAAQERLFAAGIIENVPYGPPSKGTKRITRKA